MPLSSISRLPMLYLQSWGCRRMRNVHSQASQNSRGRAALLEAPVSGNFAACTIFRYGLPYVYTLQTASCRTPFLNAQHHWPLLQVLLSILQACLFLKEWRRLSNSFVKLLVTRDSGCVPTVMLPCPVVDALHKPSSPEVTNIPIDPGTSSFWNFSRTHFCMMLVYYNHAPREQWSRLGRACGAAAVSLKVCVPPTMCGVSRHNIQDTAGLNRMLYLKEALG